MIETDENNGWVRTADGLKIYIPECCREGWESCKHGVQKFKKKKRNVGL